MEETVYGDNALVGKCGGENNDSVCYEYRGNTKVYGNGEWGKWVIAWR